MRSNIDIVGIDESKQMVSRVSKRIKSLGYTPSIIRGNVISLPFKENHFTQVVSTFPSDYIFNAKVISEIYRVLMPGGQLIILPFASIKGKLWYEKIANRLFEFEMVTQTLCEKYCLAIIQQGFEVKTNQFNDARSSIFFIVATKPDQIKPDRTDLLNC